MTKLIRHTDYFISRTGDLKQHYVLWCEQEISGGHFYQFKIFGICNLGHDKDEAIARAEKRVNVSCGETKTISEGEGFKFLLSLDFNESRKRDIVKFSALDLEWKATAKGYRAIPNESFWDKWRADKWALKAEGFSVIHMNGNRPMYDGAGEEIKFLVFISKESVEGDPLTKKTAEQVKAETPAPEKTDLDKKIEDLKAKGGKCPEGRVDVVAYLIGMKLKKYNPDDDGVMKGTWITEDGVRVWGTLPKSDFDFAIGKKYQFKATISPSKDDTGFGFYSRPGKPVEAN